MMAIERTTKVKLKVKGGELCFSVRDDGVVTLDASKHGIDQRDESAGGFRDLKLTLAELRELIDDLDRACPAAPADIGGRPIETL